MNYRDTRLSLKTLYGVAANQGGYFTAKQAATAGYGYPHLAYHLEAGNFEAAGHGLYRIPTLPPAEQDDLIRLSLWSRDRRDEPQAVVSHASALFLHQLSDVMPQRIHLTVPPSFRKRPPAGCTLHKTVIAAADIEIREGFSVTTPLRTLVDAATGRGITQEQIDQAIKDALQRGLVRESVLKKALSQALPAKRLGHYAALIGQAHG